MKNIYENKLNTKNLTLDSRSHAFNVGIAQDFGIHIALFLGHLSFWAEKNLANKKHIHDGLVWSYDTLSAIGDYFPYFTRNQVEHMINKCVNAGLVTTGNYNKTGYDRTNWYALTPGAYVYFPHLASKKYVKLMYDTISEKSEMDFTNFRNGFLKNPTPIPDTDPYPIPDECGADKSADTHTVSSLKKEQAEKSAIEDESIKKIFNEKFSGYDISIEELFKQCQEHYEQKSLWATKDKFMKWVKRERIENYKKKSDKPLQQKSPFTKKEWDIINDYRHALRSGQELQAFFTTDEKLRESQALYMKAKELEVA